MTTQSPVNAFISLKPYQWHYDEVQDKNIYKWINSSPSACIDLIQTPYNLQQNASGNQATIYN